MHDSQQLKSSLGNFDKEAFLSKLKDNLLQIPNIPLKKENYVGVDQNLEIGNVLKQRNEDKMQEIEEKNHFGQQQMEEFKTQNKRKRNYLNLFSVDRGECRICLSKEIKCSSYRACFNIESFRGIDIFQCMNCGCAMNSHNKVQAGRSFSNLICKHINRRYIKPTHFDFKALTAIFFVDRDKQKNFEIDVETFVSGLNEGSFNIFSFYELEIVELQKLWIEKTLYSLKLQIPKDQYEDYTQFLERFLELFDICGHDGIYNMRKRLLNPNDIEKLEFFMNLLNKVNKKLMKPFSSNQIALVFLITAQRSNPYQDFKKFLKGTQEQIPKELQYFYSSKSKYHGIRDGILFFPQFFKLSISSFLITQTLDDEMKNKAQINDTFKDLLDFNNFHVIKEKFNEYGLEKLKLAFSFMNDSTKFLNYCTNEGGLNLKIVSKIGPQSVTVLSQSMPNFYRIASPLHNQNLCDNLCPELYTNQRVLVIYRPLIVKSGIEEILGALWRVNDFVVIKRLYKRFSNYEVLLLAQMEHIHPENLNSYISMMTDGFSLLMLYARPGAYAASKVMTFGCETGLRVRKSQIFTDVVLEHPMKSGMVFKEKLQMNFHNSIYHSQFIQVFESYTEQNIFRSIRDLFDLEELVLQENANQQSQNVFMDDLEDKVFLAQKHEVKTTGITGTLRQQIVKDLTQENFNFYVYSTPDEISTEQLTSLFMSDCTQVQQIYVVIKPLLNTEIKKEAYLDSVQKLLKRMNFTILDIQEYILLKDQATDLLDFLSPIQLPTNIMDQYVNLYSQNNVFFLSLVKPGGKYEMKNFLGDFNFQLNQQLVLPSLIHELRPILIPCLNVEIFKFVSKQFNPYLDCFDGSIFITNDNYPNIEQKKYILNYILMCTFGVQIDSNANYEIMSWRVYEEVKQPNHLHLKVLSKNHGQFEIRIRMINKLSRYNLDYYLVVGEYQLLSWYYAKVNLKLKQRCPIAYQYRVLHEERAKQGEFDQVFDCQEFCGRIFLRELYHQIFQFGNDVFQKIKSSQLTQQSLNLNSVDKYNQRSQFGQLEQQMQKVAKIMEARSKIIAYFWGVKLAKFTKELELIDADEFPNGYGEICANQDGFQCKHKINSDDSHGLYEVEKKKYTHIMQNINSYINERMDLDPHYDDSLNKNNNSQIQQNVQVSMVNQNYFSRAHSNDQKTSIERQLSKYFGVIFGKDGQKEPSSLLIYSLEQRSLRLLPTKIDLTNLRIILDKEYIKQTFDGAGGGMQFDHHYEQHQTMKKAQALELGKKTQIPIDIASLPKDKDSKPQAKAKSSVKQPLNNYVLVHCFPAIKSRFSLAANIQYLLQVELRIQKQYNSILTLEVFQEDDLFKSMMQGEDLKAEFNKLDKTQQQQQMNKSENHASLSYISWFKERFVLDKEKVIESLIKGFDDSYFLEEEVIQKVQALNKENLNKKKTQTPDIVNMWLFLQCLEELDAYITATNEIQLREAQVQQQLMVVFKQIQQSSDQNDQHQELKIEEQHYQREQVILTQKKVKVEALILSIFKFLLSKEFKNKFYFDSEETELQFNQIKQREEKFNMDYYIEYIQNNLVSMDSLKAEEEMQTQLNNFFVGKAERNIGKEFISSKRYFLPLETGVDKLNQEEIDDRIKIINEKQAEFNVKQLEQFKNAPYMENGDKDDIQQKWIEGLRITQQGRFLNKRSDKKKIGIYVDTVKTMDKKLDENIDAVIKKFMTDKMNNFQKK